MRLHSLLIKIGANQICILTRPFEIKLVNSLEIRMGSPYNQCEIEILGKTNIVLPKYEWQDKYCWSNDNTKLILIAWNFEENIPGFHFCIFDIESGCMKRSEKIFGLLNSLILVENKIEYSKFIYNKEESKLGELCCNIYESYYI
jgi:hypothetical protein